MNERINEKVGAWLLEEGNTKTVLAERIGISRPALNKRLDGRAKWKWGEVVEIADLTNCSLNELAGMTKA